MKVQDFIIEETRRATDALFEAARKIPADKLEWSPEGQGRSVLSQCQECAQSPTWPVGLIRTRKFNWSQEDYQTMLEERHQWTTIDACEEACRKNLAELEAVVAGLRDEELHETVNVPFGKNHEWRIADIANLHAWNCHYHTGQINYIQTLYGDKSFA